MKQRPPMRRLGVVGKQATFSPKLAAEIGLNESFLLLQLDYWIELGSSDPANHHRDGRYWTYQSVGNIQEFFHFMGRATIQRAIESLVEQGLISTTSEYNRRKSDKTRWFAINYEACGALDALALKDEQPVPDRNDTVPNRNGPVPLRNNLVPIRNDVTIEDTESTPESTGDTPPTPSRGSDDAPPSIEEVARPDSPRLHVQEPVPSPPTPSPALERAEARILDARRSLDRQSSRTRVDTSNGWDTQPPERMETIKERLWQAWREKNPSRISRKDLARVPFEIAPDEVSRFQAQTLAYLNSVDEPQFLQGFKKWLEGWRDWVPMKQVPKKTEAPSVYEEQEQWKLVGRTRKEA